MQEKHIQVSFEDGTVWAIPARIVAHDRARYYADKEGEEMYQVEFDITMSDDYEIEDWVSNNMNWSDVAPHAKRLPEKQKVVDYQKEWTNADREIVMLDLSDEVQS